jgi:hypothetical protein
VIHRFITGLAIGVAATGVCYALAATTAGRIAAAIAPESVRNARMGTFDDTAKRRESHWTAIKDWSRRE